MLWLILSCYKLINKLNFIMKKLFTTLALVAGLSFGAFAQHCIGVDSTNIIPGTGNTPGLSPSSAELACAMTGTFVSDTVYFTNFSSFQGQAVQSLTIDSIGNLPAGVCWVTNHKNNTFGPGENGVIYVSGTVGAAAGQYSLQIFIHGTFGVITLPHNTNANTLANLYYYVRVTDATIHCCPELDTVNGKTHPFIAYTASSPCSTLGVNAVQNDLSNISVVPNPFTTSANVTFNSDLEGTYTVKMMNLLGAVVATKEVNITRGANQTSIERNGLSSGIYILSISNGSSSISRKVIIE
jgi:hypothetical protein